MKIRALFICLLILFAFSGHIGLAQNTVSLLELGLIVETKAKPNSRMDTVDQRTQRPLRIASAATRGQGLRKQGG